MANSFSFCAESALALTTRKPTIDHFSKAITVSEAFMRAAMHEENGECAYLQMLRETCPGYTFVRSKSRKPAKGQKKITYDKMRKYIGCLRDSKRLLEMFERVVVFGRSHDNPYQIVSEWFSTPSRITAASLSLILTDILSLKPAWFLLPNCRRRQQRRPRKRKHPQSNHFRSSAGPDSTR